MKWRSTDDLHGISRELLEAHHGAGLLSAYRYSPLAILLAAYPDYVLLFNYHKVIYIQL